MGIPAVVTGVACRGDAILRAFAMMQDRGSDSSFQKRALLGVNTGAISNNYPAGYATRHSIETSFFELVFLLRRLCLAMKESPRVTQLQSLYFAPRAML